MLNKKSQVEDLLAFLFIVIVMVFGVIFFPSKSIAETRLVHEKINTQTTSQDSKELLINYVRSPLTSKDFQNMNMEDAINIYFITNDGNLLKQISEVAKEFFSKSGLDTESSSWSLEIEYLDKKPITIESEKSTMQYNTRREISGIIIPTYYGDKFMKIRLFQTEKAEATSGLL